MENLLTKEDINEILSNNRDNPVFKYYGVRLMATDKHSFKEVIAISDKNNLILIKGNEDTGNEHIRERHNFWSTKKYIVPDNNGELKFQNQSRFPMDVAPINYLKIADEIYSKENLIEDNPHPMAEKFDLYIGEYQFEKPKKEKVKLLLYKGTKIIHSLFLARDSYNQKRVKKFPFARGKVKFKIKKDKGIEETFIPYYDVNTKLRYGISIEKYPNENMEHIYLLIFNPKDYSYHNFIKLLERELTHFPTKKHEEVTYQHCDLREVERYIMNIDYGIENGYLKYGEQ
ncbi:MAG: hypothetical protein CMC05_12755 [Flavobacteriaceae bacterium]|nr:hypothetical protein [Flavobacteriaceae bacterium]|tara:strand:+ start:9469 stop:10329 length:861 start_codon:yes stop_codon:yes gene_type:complete